MKERTSDEWQIIERHGQPEGIRNRSGFQILFPRVCKFEGQDERYREEISQRVRLAEFVLLALRSAGVKCVHCNGKGVQAQHYDEEQGGWSDPDIPCQTCSGSGRILTVEQYLKTVPANWHEDSSVETWFPLLNEEVERLRRAEKDCLQHHVGVTVFQPDDASQPRRRVHETMEFAPAILNDEKALHQMIGATLLEDLRRGKNILVVAPTGTSATREQDRE